MTVCIPVSNTKSKDNNKHLQRYNYYVSLDFHQHTPYTQEHKSLHPASPGKAFRIYQKKQPLA